MKPLRHADALHLEAAQGWLELDNHLEAHAELKRIGPEFAHHPEVLEVRWKICAKAQNWETCLEIAEVLADVAPRRPLGWLYLAASLSELNQIEEAYETLVEIVGDFPDNPAILYQLACYACGIGEIEEGFDWLQQAFSGDTSKELRAMALKDPALRPLWARIQKPDPKSGGGASP